MVFHENPEPHKFTAKADDWKLYLRIECKNKDQGLSIEQHINPERELFQSFKLWKSSLKPKLLSELIFHLISNKLLLNYFLAIPGLRRLFISPTSVWGK